MKASKIILWNPRKMEFLLVKGNNGWSLPGGKLEEGEDYDTALDRELEEELNIGIGDVFIGKPLVFYVNQTTDTQILIYAGFTLRSRFKIGHEIQGYKWVNMKTNDSEYWTEEKLTPIMERMIIEYSEFML